MAQSNPARPLAPPPLGPSKAPREHVPTVSPVPRGRKLRVNDESKNDESTSDEDDRSKRYEPRVDTNR
jgi:hypothetical protein